MDQNTVASDENAELEALRSTGMSDALAALIAEASREHDAAGRPPIALTFPVDHLPLQSEQTP